MQTCQLTRFWRVTPAKTPYDPRRVIVFTRKIAHQKIDAKWVKKDNSNSIKIGCTTLDGAFLGNGCNQQKIAARQFGELFL
jgi:hypothetical protein